MDIIDFYDKDKCRTGETGTHTKDGVYRLVVHLCLFSKGRMLIQKRSENCIKWAGLWDLTVSGCALKGENGRDAAMRELREELGLELDLSNARPAFTVSFKTGFDEVFLTEADVDISQIKLQEDEVSDVC